MHMYIKSARNMCARNACVTQAAHRLVIIKMVRTDTIYLVASLWTWARKKKTAKKKAMKKPKKKTTTREPGAEVALRLRNVT